MVPFGEQKIEFVLRRFPDIPLDSYLVVHPTNRKWVITPVIDMG